MDVPTLETCPEVQFFFCQHDDDPISSLEVPTLLPRVRSCPSLRALCDFEIELTMWLS